MSLIMKNLLHRNFKGKVKKDCGKMQGIGEKKMSFYVPSKKKTLYLQHKQTMEYDFKTS